MVELGILTPAPTTGSRRVICAARRSSRASPRPVFRSKASAPSSGTARCRSTSSSARIRAVLGAQRRHVRSAGRADRRADRAADADPRSNRLGRAAAGRSRSRRRARLRRDDRGAGQGGVPRGRHAAVAARPERRHAAHGRDGVSHVAVRGDRSRHGGRQTARRDPRGRPRRSDERPHRALRHRHVPPAADARVDRATSSKASR